MDGRENGNNKIDQPQHTTASLTQMTTTQSVRELADSPEFQCFMEIWQQTRSPPPEFQDYLYERGHYRAAGAVKWCVECPDRENWYPDGTSRPFPSRLSYVPEPGFFWIDGDSYSDGLPWVTTDTNREFPTLTEALFFLLDSYPEELL